MAEGVGDGAVSGCLCVHVPVLHSILQRPRFHERTNARTDDPDLRERASYRRFITQEARFHQVHTWPISFIH